MAAVDPRLVILSSWMRRRKNMAKLNIQASSLRGKGGVITWNQKEKFSKAWPVAQFFINLRAKRGGSLFEGGSEREEHGGSPPFGNSAW